MLLRIQATVEQRRHRSFAPELLVALRNLEQAMILKLEQKQKTDRKVFALVVAQWVTEQVAAG